MPLKEIRRYISQLRENAPELVALTLPEEITGLDMKTIYEILGVLKHNTHLASLEFFGRDIIEPNEPSRSSKSSSTFKPADNQGNTTLTSLLLYSIFNNSDEDVKCLAARLPFFFPNLTHLSFQNNDIGSEAINALALALEKLEHLTHLDISGSMLGSNANCIFEHLPTSTIRHLRLQNAGLELSEIEALNEALRRTTSLKTLDLFLNVSSMQLDALRIENCPLASLNLSFCGIDGSKSYAELFDQIRDHKSLIELNLSRNMIKAVSTINFAKMLACGHFRMLDLSNNILDSLDSFSQIIRNVIENKNLRTLNLRNTQIRDENIPYISWLIKGHNTLTSLDLSDNSLGQYAIPIIQALQQNSSLVSIKLRNIDFDDSAVNDVNNMLENNHTLKSIDLSYNKFSSEIALSAISLPYLKSISFRGYHIGTQRDKTDIVFMLAGLLGETQTLTHIDLGDNEFGADAITAICQALKQNRSIASINLSHSRLNSQAITALIELLNTNTHLTSIDLSECLIDRPEDLEKLSATIPSCKLTYLNLSQLRLSSHSHAPIKKALPHLMAINNQIACNKERYRKAFPLHAAIKFLQGAEREVEIEILLQQSNVSLLSDDSRKDILEHPEAIELTPEIIETLNNKYREQYEETYPLHVAIKFLSGERRTIAIIDLFNSGKSLPSIDDKGCSVMDLAKEQPQDSDNLVALLELQDCLTRAPTTAAMNRYGVRRRQQPSRDIVVEQADSDSADSKKQDSVSAPPSPREGAASSHTTRRSSV